MQGGLARSAVSLGIAILKCPSIVHVGLLEMIYLEVSSTTVDDETDPDRSYTSWTFGDVTLQQPSNDFRSIADNFGLVAGDVIFLVVAIWSTGDSMSTCDDGSCDIMSAHKFQWDADISVVQLRNATKAIRLQDGYTIPHLPWTGWFDDLSRVEVIQRIIK